MSINKNYIDTLFLTVIILLLSPVLASAAYNVDYYVTIPDPSSGSANVVMTITGVQKNKPLTICEFPDNKYATIDVTKIIAYGENGQELPISRDPSSGHPEGLDSIVKWYITTGDNEMVRVEYTASVNNWGGRPPGIGYMEVNYIGSDWAAVRGAAIFLAPLDGTDLLYDSVIGKVRMRFDLPQGWGLYTPWEKDDDGYIPIFDNPHPHENWATMIRSTSLAMGNFVPYRNNFGNTEVTVAVYGGWSESERNRLAQETLSVYNYLYEVFGPNRSQRYLIIMNPVSDDGSRICTGKYSNSTGVYCEYNQGLGFILTSQWLLNHDMSHHWNQFSYGYWGLKNQGEWWVEGPTTFYEVSICDTLGLPFGDGLEGRLKEYYEIYINEYVNKGADRPLDGRDGVSLGYSEFFDYRKSVLVLFLLAKEISIRTNNTKTFNSFMNYFYQKYKDYRYGINCDAYTVLDELNTYIGSDFSGFFEDYIFGTTTVDISWGYGDDDSDGRSNAKEISIGTNPWATD